MIVSNQNHYDRVVDWRCSNIMKNITVIIINNTTMIVLKFCFLFSWISSHHTIPSWKPFFCRCVKLFNFVKLFSVFFLIIVVLWSMWVTLPNPLANLLEMKLVLIIIHITQRIMIESKQNLNHGHQTQWLNHIKMNPKLCDSYKTWKENIAPLYLNSRVFINQSINLSLH